MRAALRTGYSWIPRELMPITSANRLTGGRMPLPNGGAFLSRKFMREESLMPDEHRSKVQLFLSYASVSETEVPDPYYGGAAGFERVLDLVEEASRGLLETLSK